MVGRQADDAEVGRRNGEARRRCRGTGAQLVVVLGALAWMAASVGITEKSVVVWQAVALRRRGGRDVVGRLSIAVNAVVPEWHCEQSPALGWLASATLCARRGARPRLEALVLRARRLHGRRDRIDAHAHPHVVGLVAGGAAAGHAGVDLRSGRRRRGEQRAGRGARRAAGIRPLTLASVPVAALAGGARRDVRARAHRRGRRHADDARDAGEGRRAARAGGRPRSCW